MVSGMLGTGAGVGGGVVMADVDFSNHDSAEAWFATQSIEMRCAMTSRGALRVVANVRLSVEEYTGSLALTALRAILTSAGRGLGRPADVQELDSAALSAASAAFSAARSADSAADSAALSAFSAARSADSAADSAALSAASAADSAALSAAFYARSAAFSAALSTFSDDAAAKAPDLYARAVWGKTKVPESVAASHLEFLEYLNSDPNWAFWRRWYEQMWEGTFRDWDLAIEVAKIPDEVWKGDDALAKVATAIREIEARFRTSVAVPLIRNDQDSAFSLADEAPLPEELLEYVKERVGGALDTALKASGNNVFDENCAEALAISQALQSTNPSAVAGLLHDASLMFQTNLGDRYPEDGQLIALQAAAFSSAGEICEIDEVARKRCLHVSQLYLREHPAPLDQAEFEEFAAEIAKEAEGEAKEIIETDGLAIATGKRVGRFVRARYANYASTIVQWIDGAKKNEARISWLWKKVRELMNQFGDPPT